MSEPAEELFALLLIYIRGNNRQLPDLSIHSGEGWVFSFPSQVGTDSGLSFISQGKS